MAGQISVFPTKATLFDTGQEVVDSEVRWRVGGNYKPMKGALIEPPRTNKCTCRKANPVDTTNLVPGGTTTTIVGSLDALTVAGLSGICNGNVYETVLPHNAAVVIGGEVGNVNPHSSSVYARVISGGGVQFGQGLSTRPTFDNSDFELIEQANVVPVDTLRTLVFYNQSGAESVVQWILPQLEEGAFCTSPIYQDATGDDPLTSLTRTASVLSGTSAGVLKPNDLCGRIQVIPSPDQNARYMFSCDSNGGADGVSILCRYNEKVIRKRISSVASDATISYVHAEGVPFQLEWYLSSSYGMGIRVREQSGLEWGAWSAWATNADTSDVLIADTYEIGTRLGGSHSTGNYPMFKTVALPTDCPDLASLQALLDNNHFWEYPA